MTERQKEMLAKRALLEFLEDYPEYSTSDILGGYLAKEIFVQVESGITSGLDLSHYALLIKLTEGRGNILYIPKERFSTKEEK